jgi:quercetin dioxygenase-like cupin family protein
MSERPRSDLSGVRDAMRARDDAPSNATPPAAGRPVGEGPSEMASGVSTTQIDFAGEERFQTLRRELGVSAFGVNVIRLRPGQRGRIHRHLEQEEVYLVLEGTLTLEIEGEPRELGRGELARVAPDVRRRLVNRHREPLLLFALGSAKEHQGRDGRAWSDWDEPGEGRPPQDVPQADDVPI